MWIIRVLGTGCPECGDLARLTQRLIAELKLPCEFSQVADLYEILSYNVMTTPALVIDGEVVVTGWVPALSELREILREKCAL